MRTAAATSAAIGAAAGAAAVSKGPSVASRARSVISRVVDTITGGGSEETKPATVVAGNEGPQGAGTGTETGGDYTGDTGGNEL